MKNVLSRVLSIVLLSLAVAPLSGGALAQGSGALGVRDDSNPAYWSDRWRGWHFYEDPPQEEVEPPSRPAPSTAPRPTASPRPPELVEFERLQKTLEDLRNIAIMRPSEANVRRYMELEMQVVNRASYFADVAQRVAAIGCEGTTTASSALHCRRARARAARRKALLGRKRT